MKWLVLMVAATALVSGCGHPDNGRYQAVIREGSGLKVIDTRTGDMWNVWVDAEATLFVKGPRGRSATAK